MFKCAYIPIQHDRFLAVVVLRSIFKLEETSMTEATCLSRLRMLGDALHSDTLHKLELILFHKQKSSTGIKIRKSLRNLFWNQKFSVV
jgi:hypothetical protein